MSCDCSDLALDAIQKVIDRRRDTIGTINETQMDPLLVQAHDSGYSALLDAQSEIDRAFNERQDS